MKPRKIFTSNGVVDIYPGKLYAVSYLERGVTKISSGCYLNYYNDNYIGKDDEYRMQHGPRFYLDDLPQDDDIQIMSVISQDEFRQKVMDRIFPDW